MPGSRGPIPPRKISSPPTEIASSEAPWKASHIDTVLWRPVAARASLSAMPIAPVPLGQKSTLFRSPGASAASFFARSTAGRFV